MPTPNAPADAAIQRFRDDLTGLAGAIGPSARIGLAVSGGPDSLALLLLAHATLSGRVATATVDHGLRSGAADEAAMVGELCTRIGVPHAILRPALPIDASANVQERARTARYGLLAEWAQAEGIGLVATAHHRDDVAESFLMRALRGAGVGGLARMKAISTMPYASDADLKLVRPLLDWSRTELGDIVRDAGLVAVEDPSNSDPRYDRVRIRTLLQREALLDPEPLAHAAANLADAEAALQWSADLAWRSRVREQSASEIVIDPGDLPSEIRRRLASRAIGVLAPGWSGDGLDTMLTAIEGGGIATLAGVKASGGTMWRFVIAPARRTRR